LPDTGRLTERRHREQIGEDRKVSNKKNTVG
jgi:hypothetical protein